MQLVLCSTVMEHTKYFSGSESFCIIFILRKKIIKGRGFQKFDTKLRNI